MKSTRLLAAMLVGMLAASMSGVTQSITKGGIGAAFPKPPKTAMPSRTVGGSARNGGKRGSNRGHQRMAMKRRNVTRNRLAHRA